MKNRESFAFSAENPTGTHAGGTRGKDCEKLRPCVEIAPGEVLTLVDTEGPGMITHIWLTGYVGHSFVMRIYWDGAQFPSVEAPISAFFGSAYDENFETVEGGYSVLDSALLLVAPGRGLNSYFEMPFRKSCRITVENRGGRRETLFYMISGWHGEISSDAGFFHAAYRQEHPVTKGRSYTVLDGVEGKGVFVGMTLAAGMNGNNTCWVEGEARMYIDGDIYPTMNYTGTEDYFGGSFNFGNDSDLHEYTPVCGQYVGLYAVLGNMNEYYNHQQRFLLYRWHVRDPIFFEESFRMVIPDMSGKPRYDDFASVAFWYLTEPKGLPMTLPPERELDVR
jgi:hypothetical protein